ncbi:MAG TPA: hypothetical protein VM582_01740 [Candidatus Thermoplasmatota archaeon]|nr:hypothetical protein [Candidatus Thermoplasmatota archaeon]
MDALADLSPASTRERARLTTAHHEICTALTVFRSNLALVRIRLTDDPTSIPIHVHLEEIDLAIDRLHGIAHELKRWHDEAA